MTDSSITGPSYVASALRTLHAVGRVTLPGRIADPHLRLRRRRKIIDTVCAVICGLGLLGPLAGFLLRDRDIAPVLVGIGVPLFIGGLISTIVMVAMSKGLQSRMRAETQPVTIDAQGIRLRGIGPIPWSDVYPPQYLKVTTRGDVNGMCAVMPLSPQGYARVNSYPYVQTQLVGPKLYYRASVPYLLLPGIAGVSEAGSINLFRVAYEMFSPGPDPRSSPRS